jgi:hypothetical protein
MDFLQKLWSFKIFLRTFITFLKGYDEHYSKNIKKYELTLWKKICEQLVYSYVKAGGTVPKNGFSQKRLLRFFLKIPVLECGKCPLKPLILSFCVESNLHKLPLKTHRAIQINKILTSSATSFLDATLQTRILIFLIILRLFQPISSTVAERMIFCSQFADKPAAMTD